LKPKTQLLFQRTAEGIRTSKQAVSSLPAHYREVMQCMETLTPFETIAAALPHYSKAQIAAWLEDLEAIGLVESIALEWLLRLHVLKLNYIVPGSSLLQSSP